MFSIWTMLFTLLVTELAINLVLVLHIFMFIKKGIIGILRFFFKHPALQTCAIIIAILLVYSFGFSYYTEKRLTSELNADMADNSQAIMIDATKELSLRVRVFREQRNMYISGFAFFHGIVLWRLVKLYDQFEIDRNEAHKEGHKDAPRELKNDNAPEPQANEAKAE